MKIISVILFVFSVGALQAQEAVPIQNDYIRAFDRWTIQNNGNFNTAVKPYLIRDTLFHADSVFSFGIQKPTIRKGLFARKWSYEPLVMLREKSLSLNVDPLFDMSLFKDNATQENYYTNSRGIRISGDLDKEFFFETSFIETQSSFPEYVTDYIHKSLAVPGQGQARRYNEGFLLVEPALEVVSSGNIDFKDGFDYSIASGTMGFRVNRNFIASLGHGKFFVGEGYRSVLLSHNSFNYPFLRVDAHFGNFSYSRIMAILMEDTMPKTSFGVRDKKLAGFNILSWQPQHFLQFSVFEGTVWDFPDAKKKIDADYNFYNPIIFSNSIIYRKNHFTVLGTSLKINIFKCISVYSQLGWNNSKGNTAGFKSSMSYQLGIKYFDVFGLRNLYFQAEHNSGAKSYGSNPDNYLPYSHYNQSLAHPMGVNFKESILIIKYNYKKAGFECKFQMAAYGDENITPVIPKNSFAKTFYYTTPFIGKGPRTELNSLNLNIFYMLNAFSNRKIELGFQKRDASWQFNNYANEIFYFSFKTSISESFYDF